LLFQPTEAAPTPPMAPAEPVQSQPASQNAQSEPMAIHPSPVRCSPSRQSSRDSLEEEEEGQAGDSDIDGTFVKQAIAVLDYGNNGF